MIIITAKKDGFRRCGLAHSARPVEYPDEAFSPEQLAELQAEPMLVVELVADKPDEKAPASDQDPMLVVELVATEDQGKDPEGGTKKAGKKAGKE